MTPPRFSPELAQINAYPISDATGFIKLDAMENPYPFPPELMHQLAERLVNTALNRYPDNQFSELNTLVYQKLRIPNSSKLIFGNGSDELITLITQSITTPNACVLAPSPSFVMYRFNALLNRVRFLEFELNSNDFSIEKTCFLNLIQQEKPSLIWLAYPNNPTGQLFDDQLIEQVLRLAPDSLVILDEAYQPFAEHTWSTRLPEFENLLVLRTLSKLGLAGIRFGYLAGHDSVISQINKLKPPYNINVLTKATAELALEHYDLFRAQTDQINRDRAQLFEQLSKIDQLQVFESHANFLLFRIKSTNNLADHIYQRLKNDFRILIKNVSTQAPILHNCLRVSIGTAQENQLFLTALHQIMSTLPR
jgi:histidinol-phosphate aminotransferase